MNSFFKSVSIDLRSLGLFRILIGVVLFVEFLFALINADYFYNNNSFFSKELIQSSFGPNFLSLFFFNDSAQFVSICLVLGMVASILFIVGRYYKVSQIFLLLLWGSLVNRNLVIANSGDDILFLALLWSLFLPLDEAFSLKSKTTIKPYNLTHPMTLPFILQLMFIYVFASFEKAHPVWNQAFTAIEYTLHLDSLRTAFGAWLLNFPIILKAGTWLTYYGEFIGPCLFFIPIFYSRILIIFFFIFLHCFILLTLNIGSFPLICIIYWLALLPSEFWDMLADVTYVSMEQTQIRCSNLKPFAFCLGAFLFIMNCFYVINSSFLPYVEPVTNLLRLRQKWSMFAPAPKTGDGRLVFQGNLKNGTIVDVHPPYSRLSEGYKRDDFSNTFLYPNTRWHKVAENLRSRDFSSFLIPFAKWVCREQKTNQLEWLYLYVVEGPTVLGQENITLPRRLLIRWECSKT